MWRCVHKKKKNALDPCAGRRRFYLRMGGVVSISKEDLEAEKLKPLDASDITDIDTAKAEIVRVRQMIKAAVAGMNAGADPASA